MRRLGEDASGVAGGARAANGALQSARMAPPTELHPDLVLRRCPDVRFRTVLDEGVVIKQDTAEVLVLNEVGARVLELLDGTRTVGDVETALAREFDAPAAELGRDLESYVEQLLAAGIVEAAPRP